MTPPGPEPTADLAREPYVSLATFRRDGRAVETPVWVAGAEGRLYVFTEAKAGKVKRLRREPRLRLAACGMSGRIRGPWHEGHGRIVTEPDLEARAYDALLEKYGWQMRLANLGSWLTGRLEGRAVLELTIDPTGAT